MIYLILIMGFVLFIYGLTKSLLSENENFEEMYRQAENKEVKIVQHTISEEALKKDIELLKKEMEAIKMFIASGNSLKKGSNSNLTQLNKKEENNADKKGISFESLSQRLMDIEEEDSLEALSKETKIGKGELLLLKKLSQK